MNEIKAALSRQFPCTRKTKYGKEKTGEERMELIRGKNLYAERMLRLPPPRGKKETLITTLLSKQKRMHRGLKELRIGT